MNTIPVADIIAIITCLALVAGAIYSGRKATAEAASAYSNAAANAVDSQKKLQDQIDELRLRLDKKEAKIERLEQQVDHLTRLNERKDGRIAELEALTIRQQNEINSLRSEIDTLRSENTPRL